MITAEPKVAAADATKSPESTLPDVLTKAVPSTPAGKLALPDLIGMGDIRRTVLNVSPEDRIEWDHHSSNSSFAVTTKKRARSSSPTSSPAAKTPSRFNDKGELVHPQLDPGSELWGRYSLSGSTPQGHTIPALAHLMHTSSPQISKEKTAPRTMPGFRRANSCGNQFPKRRRIGGPDEDIFTEGAGGGLGPSKLSVLIERVQEGLVQPKQPHPEVKCSEPPFISGELPSGENRSCIPPRAESPEEKGTAQDYAHCDPQIQPKDTPTALHSSRSDGSDYGEFEDDDLDDITLLGSISQPHQPPIPSSDALSRPEPQPTTSDNGHEHTGFHDGKTDDNEFDDSDDDLLAADLEDMLAKYDSQRPTEPHETAMKDRQKSATALKTDSDDEFGDGGFDDLDFEIAEAAATQSKQHANSSFLPVRTKFP